MKKKSVMKLIIVLTLLLSLVLSGCSNNKVDSNDPKGSTGGETNEMEAQGQTEFTLVGIQQPLAPDWNEMQLFQDLEAETGIHIDWNLVGQADWETKRSLMLTNKNIDGYFAASYPDYDFVEATKDGVFIPLDDLIAEYAPNVQKVFERAPYLKALVTHEDGHIYSLPVSEELALGDARNFVSINKTWLDAVGLDVPTNAEEFKEALIAFRDNDVNGNGDPNDEIPFSFLNMWWCSDIGDLMAAFGIPDNGEHIIVKDGELIFTADKDEYRAGLEYFADLYAEGLIDPEAFTAPNEFQLLFAKGQSNTLGSYIWWETAEVAGEYKDDYVLMPVWTNDAGEQVTGRANGKDGGKQAFMITANCEDPVTLIQWVDKLYEPNMAAKVHWGPPGEDNLLIEDESGKLAYNTNLQTEAGERRQQIAPNGVGVILKEDFGTVVDAEPRAMERLQQVRELYEPYMPKDNWPRNYVSQTDEELEIIGEYELLIMDYVKEQRAKFITEGITDEAWNNYINNLNDYGLQELMDAYQTGFDRYLSK